MPTVYQGKLTAAGLAFGIVVSRWNEFITSRLLAGALDALERHGADPAAIDVAWVPGSFEIPIVAQEMARSGHYRAVLCLGALIRGATPHFDYLAAAVASGISSAGLSSGVPVVFGVLTTNTVEQATDRAGGKHGNKGWDAAMVAMETASVLERLPKRETGGKEPQP
jgi:6,7-dimethyl-8-ribityllumazine synthase